MWQGNKGVWGIALMKKVSVIVSTARLGGIDVLANSMALQTLPKEDFEIIVIDEWYPKRCKYENLYGLNLRFYPPDFGLDYYDPCNGCNTGLSYATGDLICYLTDFIWVPSNYLEEHLKTFALGNSRKESWSLSAYTVRYPFTVLNTREIYHVESGDDSTRRSFYIQSEAEHYVNLMKNKGVESTGQKTCDYTEEDLYFSIFKHDWTEDIANVYFNTVVPQYIETKGGVRNFQVTDELWTLPAMYFYAALNHSIPRKVLEELNGWDERYDGGYAACDVDIGLRAEYIGHKFMVNPNFYTYKFGSHANTVVPKKEKKMIRGSEDNLEMLKKKVKDMELGASVITPLGYGLDKHLKESK